MSSVLFFLEVSGSVKSQFLMLLVLIQKDKVRFVLLVKVTAHGLVFVRPGN